MYGQTFSPESRSDLSVISWLELAHQLQVSSS